MIQLTVHLLGGMLKQMRLKFWVILIVVFLALSEALLCSHYYADINCC